jgi:hypothetical protein
MLKLAILAVGMWLCLFDIAWAQSNIITSFTLTAPQTRSLAPFVLGYAFKQGDVPSGTTVIASIPNFQATIKTRWSDGSAQFAILAGRVNLQANVPLTVSLSAGTLSSSGTNLTESDLASQGANALVTFQGIGSVELSNLIGRVGAFNSTLQQWGPGKVVDWVQGPEMSSWIYSSPMGSDPSLSAWFEVRLWQGGAVEILPWIENGYLLKPGGNQKIGTASVTISGVSRFSQSLTVLHHTRTVLCAGTTLSYWLGNDPQVTPRHDTSYLQKSKLVPTYGSQTPSTSSLFSRLVTSYIPFAQSNYSNAMGQAGYQPAIGLLPEWDVAYLTSGGDVRALAAVVINAYSAGRYGIHYRDEKTNRPVRFSSIPHLVLLDTNSGVSDVGVSSTSTYTPATGGGIPPTWDNAHHPSVGYFAYIVTGRFYFMEEIEFSATLAFLKQTDTVRQLSQGIMETSTGANTTRGAAWALRSLLQAFLATPDADTLKAEFRNSLDSNINYYYNRYIATPNNPQGICQPYSDYTTSGDNIYFHATWMEDFLTAVFGYMLDVQALSAVVTPKASTFFQWKAQSVIGRLGQAGSATEWDFRDAAPYTLAVAPSDTANWGTGVGPWYANFGQMYSATYAGAIGTAPPNTLQGSYFPDSTGYWGNMQPAIAYAVTLNVPGASQAYGRMTGASNWQQFVSYGQDYPVWMVIPSAGGGTISPPNAPSNLTVN